MKQFHDLLNEILVNGKVQYNERTQEYILGISGKESVFDLEDGFPVLTTKRVPLRLVFEELAWKLRGEKSVKSLFDKDVHIWDANAFQKFLSTYDLQDDFPKHTQEWADGFEIWKEKLINGDVDGDLGPVYGNQWRHWVDRNGNETDQLIKLVSEINDKPGSRYQVLDSYNPGDLPEMAIGPCPFWDQFTVYGDELELTAVQRSCDTFLGVPFNISQEALLAKMVAQEAGLKATKLRHYTINTHLYLGVLPRSEFWLDSDNVAEFQEKVSQVKDRYEYNEINGWYESKTSSEGELNKGKDHIPDTLTLLAKKPRELPSVNLKEGSLYELIEKSFDEVVEVNGYRPHKWKTTAVMAA
jgi:thymidylate synthase